MTAPTPQRAASAEEREALAAWLLGRDEASAAAEIDHYARHFAGCLPRWINEHHSGDCTKESHSCVRCIAERTYADTDDLIAKHLAPLLDRITAAEARAEEAERENKRISSDHAYLCRIYETMEQEADQGDADLLALARMYGEACGALAEYRSAGVEWQGEQAEYKAAFESQNDTLAAELAVSRAALTGMLDRYTGLVNSGDAGFWDPESEDEVIAARRALKPEGASDAG